MSETIPCQATTKAGSPCKNAAQEGSAYCYVHRNMAEPAAPEVKTPPPAAKPALDPESRRQIDDIRTVLAELNEIVENLRQRVPDFTPPPFSPQVMLDWLRGNVGRFTPQLVKDVGDELAEASAEDFKDPDTWKGIWFLITYSIKQESQELFEKISAEAAANPTIRRGKSYVDKLPTMRETRKKIESMPGVKETKEFIEGIPGVKEGKRFLSTLPGAGLVSSLVETIDDAAPADFLDPETWSGIWFVINHSLEVEWAELKKRVGDEEDTAGDDGEEIIVVAAE